MGLLFKHNIYWVARLTPFAILTLSPPLPFIQVLPNGHGPPSPAGFHPGLALALRERMESLLDSSLATTSRRTYTRAWQVFQSFHMATYGTPASIPLTPDKTAMFVAHLDSANRTRATIRTYVSALSHSHKLADVDDPTTRFWVRKVIKAAGSWAQGRAPPPAHHLGDSTENHPHGTDVSTHL